MAEIIYGSDTPQCPHCEAMFEEWYGIEELVDQNNCRAEHECNSCGNTFYILANYTVDFDTAKDESDL